MSHGHLNKQTRHLSSDDPFTHTHTFCSSSVFIVCNIDSSSTYITNTNNTHSHIYKLYPVYSHSICRIYVCLTNTIIIYSYTYNIQIQLYTLLHIPHRNKYTLSFMYYTSTKSLRHKYFFLSFYY